MKKISNRDEANSYYKQINKAVDDFLQNTKSRPSEIHKYLKYNGKSFLKRLELNDIVGIENVLSDVLLHKKHLEEDKVMTFESFFSTNERFVNVGSPSVDQEKILADLFNTSTGHIDLIDPLIHLFKINDFGDNVYAFIFSKEEIKRIHNDLCESITKDVCNKVVDINQIEGHDLVPNLKFWLGDLLDNDKVLSQVKSKLSFEMVLYYVESSCVKSNFGSSIIFKFIEQGECFIWFHKML